MLRSLTVHWKPTAPGGSREGRELDCLSQRGRTGRRVGSSAWRSEQLGPAGSHAGRRVGSRRGRRPPASPRPADISRAPPLASQHPQLPAGPSLLPPRVLPAPSRGAARTGSRRDAKDGAVTAGPEPLASPPAAPGRAGALRLAVSARGRAGRGWGRGPGAVRPLPQALGGSAAAGVEAGVPRLQLQLPPPPPLLRARQGRQATPASAARQVRWGRERAGLGGGPGRARAGERRERSRRGAAEKGKWDKMAGETRARPGARRRRRRRQAGRRAGGGRRLRAPLARTLAAGWRPQSPPFSLELAGEAEAKFGPQLLGSQAGSARPRPIQVAFARPFGKYTRRRL